MEYYNQSWEGVVKDLDSHKEKGLTNLEAKRRLEISGLNELSAKAGTNPIVLFFLQFKSFIIYILLFALVISALVGEYVDSLVILVILIFNAVFGFIQEYKAEKAIQVLKNISSQQTTVIRDGKRQTIDSKQLVAGDIIVVEEGTKIPADCRVINSNMLRLQESSLTGESTSVSKQSSAINGKKVIQDRENMLFSGTIVTSGRAIAIVTATGMKTEIGKIANLLNQEEEQTPLQKKLEDLGKKLGLGTIIISVIVFVSGLVKDGSHNLLLQGQFTEFLIQGKVWFLTAVSLAVAAVPEGLPAIVTIAFALGVRSMVKRNALIRRLPSVETLGEATVICTDKTGTITKNEMTVRKAFTNSKSLSISGEGYDAEGEITSPDTVFDNSSKLLFKIGALCNNASFVISKDKEVDSYSVTTTGDPTEIALLVSAVKAGFDLSNLEKWSREDEVPFDSNRKLMTTINKDPSTKELFVFTKGAPENILGICDRIYMNGSVRKLTNADKKLILQKNEYYAKQALRVLGFAYKKKDSKDYESNLIFVGLQAMIDPPHSEVKQSIQTCHDAGIRVIMITGDNIHTAKAIGNEVGLNSEAMEGEVFEKLSKEKQLEAIKTIDVFARVEPKHKMLIVDLLQELGEIVAMTGDGVNDAPAIKKSDLGIAMGINGTDVAKESSDMILLDDNFTTIVNAVEEGRGIYENIQKFINYLLSSNLAEVLVIFFAIIMGLPLPMTAIMLLWLNLVTDGLPALALSVDPHPANLMKRPPQNLHNKIMSKNAFYHILYVGVLITVAVLGIFYWSIVKYAGSENFLAHIQTIAFSTIVVLELVRLQSIRSQYNLGVFSNKYLVLAVATSIALQMLIIYTPLNTFFGTYPMRLFDWAIIIVVSGFVMLLDMLFEPLREKLSVRRKV